MSDITESVKKQIAESVSIKQAILADESALRAIENAADILIKAYKAGGKSLWAGNGGSAADSQHMAAELVNKFRMDRPGLPAMALTVDSSILTSVGNDYGYENVFSRQIEACGRPGDVFVGISTSGNSMNLVRALEKCREKGIVSIALVGESPCRMDAYDIVIHVPSDETPRIQECHTLIGHILCDMVEKAMFA